MEVLNILLATSTIVIMFGLQSLLLTAPAWLIGRFSVGHSTAPLSLPMATTRARRWVLFVTAVILGYVGVAFAINGAWAIGLLMGVIGLIGAEYAAFVIGRAYGERAHAVRAAARPGPGTVRGVANAVYAMPPQGPAALTPPAHPDPAMPSPAISEDYPSAEPSNEYLPPPPAASYPTAAPSEYPPAAPSNP